MELYKIKVMKSGASFTGCLDHRNNAVYFVPWFGGFFLHPFSLVHLGSSPLK